MGAIRCLEAARSAVVTGRARAINISGRMFAMVVKVSCGEWKVPGRSIGVRTS